MFSTWFKITQRLVTDNQLMLFTLQDTTGQQISCVQIFVRSSYILTKLVHYLLGKCVLEVYYKKNDAVLFDILSCVYVLVYIPCLGVPHQSQAQPISLQGIPISSHLSSFKADGMSSTKHKKVVKVVLLSHQFCLLY